MTFCSLSVIYWYSTTHIVWDIMLRTICVVPFLKKVIVITFLFITSHSLKLKHTVSKITITDFSSSWRASKIVKNISKLKNAPKKHQRMLAKHTKLE